VWATTGTSGDRWRTISGIGKRKVPNPLTSGFSDPTNPEISIEVTGGGKVNPHVCVGVSAYRVSGVEKSSG
jgi:hypothetical protein